MLQKPLKTHGAKPFDGWLIGVIFQARERGLRGQRIGFTHEGLKCGIVAQRVGVVTVLIACGDLINSLTEHLVGVVLDENRMAPVVEQPVESLVSASCASNWRKSKRPESLVISPPLKSRTIFG